MSVTTPPCSIQQSSAKAEQGDIKTSESSPLRRRGELLTPACGGSKVLAETFLRTMREEGLYVQDIWS